MKATYRKPVFVKRELLSAIAAMPPTSPGDTNGSINGAG